MRKLFIPILFAVALISCKKQEYDVIIRQGTVYDGSGNKAVVTDIGLRGDSIAVIGDLSNAIGKKEIDAKGLAVAPGFINMLSWANESLIIDGKSQSDIRQGVTLEVMGEGTSMGPWNDTMKDGERKGMRDYQYDINWTTLGEYLEYMERKGISTNIASFIGATTVRVHELGLKDRLPTDDEMVRMKELVRQAMEEGAMGVGSSLIYAPASYSSTEELIELCKTASEYGGMYISHMRSEGNNLYQGVNELLRISREAKIPAEIYHLKAGGKNNWSKMDSVIKMIDHARVEGLKITADMYTYTAGATGLDASMPTWVQEGGINEWIKRMKTPSIRKRALDEMKRPSDSWENLLLLAGTPDNVLLVGFANDSLKRYTGKTLGEVARVYGKSPEETAMDLVIADSTRVGTVYFLMSEENIKKQIALRYMSFDSDAESSAPEGVFLKSSTHPRAYGNFARLLAKYVREEKVIPLEDAIRKLTSLPAENLRIKRRGKLKVGYYADVVIFDAERIQDLATFEKPQQYAVGMVHVFVNGIQVLANGEHTGALPGRVVRGPGWKGK